MIVPVYNDSNNENPKYSCSTDAGFDLMADFSKVTSDNPIKIYGNGRYNPELKELELEPMARALVPTGIYTAIPEGYEVQVRPRSGLAVKEGLTVVNTPGTIDAGFRDEWKVLVINLGFESIIIKDGERIAQGVLNKFEKVEWENHSLEEVKAIGTDRGGGTGHSGK